MTEEQTKRTEKANNNGFDLLSKYRVPIMGLAALWILFFHAWRPALVGVPILGTIENYLQKLGFCGVDIFFFLSGIGLTYSIKKTTLGKYYYKRIKRIIVPFVIMVIARGLKENWTVMEYIRRILPYDFYTVSIYTVLWFVPAIVTLYAVFPLYYKFFEKSVSKVRFTLMGLLVWFAALIALKNTMRIDLYGFTNRIPIFMIGILCGWIAQNKEVCFTKLTYILLGFTLVLGNVLAYETNFHKTYILVPDSSSFLPNLLIAISLVFLISKIFDAMSKTAGIKCVQTGLVKVLSFVGMISFEFYCVQEWINDFIIKKMSVPHASITIDIIVLASVTVAGYILYILNKYLWELLERKK